MDLLTPSSPGGLFNINFVKDSNHFYSLGGSCSQNLQLLCQDMAKHAQTDNIAL